MKKGRIKPGILVAGLTAIGSIFGLILDVVCGHYEEKMMKEEIDAAVDRKIKENETHSKRTNQSEDDEEENMKID